MYLETAQLLQFAFAIFAGVIIFIGAYAAPLRVSVGILLVMIPFQLVDTSYGSSNVLMTYVLAGALLITGKVRYAPMLGRVLAVVFAYLISMSQVPRSVYILHGIEIIALVSGFLVFMLAYNVAREPENGNFIIRLLIWSNVLSLLYCLVQLAVGPGESIELFGSRDFSLNENRGGGDARLVGPFGTPGLTAAYFMSMTLILIYKALHSSGWHKAFTVFLVVANVAMIMATANRGSFLVLLASILWFLYLFRAELGFAKIVQILVVSTVVLVGGGSIVASQTEFGQMFDRLASVTEVRDGIPTTRSALWPKAWENIQKKPLTGHGPRIVQQPELRYRSVPDEQLVSTYPHSLYLHLLVTVGILGTTCMLFFLFGVVWRVYQGARHGLFRDNYDRGWVLVGVIVLVAILMDELKIEFLRFTTVDYAHFIFALFGIFLGWADSARAEARATETVSTSEIFEPAPAGGLSRATRVSMRAKQAD